MGKANGEINDPNFAIGIRDRKELFNSFFTCFSSLIAPLSMNETLKMYTLRRLVSASRLVNHGWLKSSFSRKSVRKPILF